MITVAVQKHIMIISKLLFVLLTVFTLAASKSSSGIPRQKHFDAKTIEPCTSVEYNGGKDLAYVVAGEEMEKYGVTITEMNVPEEDKLLISNLKCNSYEECKVAEFNKKSNTPTSVDSKHRLFILSSSSPSVSAKFHVNNNCLARRRSVGAATSGPQFREILGCSGSSRKEQGSIYFPDKRTTTKYASFQECVWNLLALPGSFFRLTFKHFDMESNPCYKDYLEIQDGESVRGYWCGTTPPGVNGVFDSQTASLRLIFYSNYAIAHTGFHVSWQTRSELQGCGGYGSADIGELYFPDKSNSNYDHNKDCVWSIRASEGYLFRIKFTSFDLEQHSTCANDYVEIEDGSTSVGKWCGTKPPADYISKNRRVKIKFHSNANVAHPGFNMNWEPVRAVTGCGGGDFEGEGILAFPDATDAKYSNNMRCNWMMTESDHKKVFRLTFTLFDLEADPTCSKDYIEIDEWDGSPTKKFCGSKAPGTNGVFTTQWNWFEIKFVSNGSVRKGGFYLTWKVIPSPWSG